MHVPVAPATSVPTVQELPADAQTGAMPSGAVYPSAATRRTMTITVPIVRRAYMLAAIAFLTEPTREDIAATGPQRITN